MPFLCAHWCYMKWGTTKSWGEGKRNTLGLLGYLKYTRKQKGQTTPHVNILETISIAHAHLLTYAHRNMAKKISCNSAQQNCCCPWGKHGRICLETWLSIPMFILSVQGEHCITNCWWEKSRKWTGKLSNSIIG